MQKRRLYIVQVVLLSLVIANSVEPCNPNGKFQCEGHCFRTCVNGAWHIWMRLAEGTDCDNLLEPETLESAPRQTHASNAPSISHPPLVSSIPTSWPSAPGRPPRSYDGVEENFPHQETWIDFDGLWELNTVCEDINGGNGHLIREVLEEENWELDIRLILAVILQESTCRLDVPWVPGGNNGVMQSWGGSGFHADNPRQSVKQMINDGVYGTLSRECVGLKCHIDFYQNNTFTGLRAYNSGRAGTNPNNLSSTLTGTGDPMYCSNIANRLTGAKAERA